MWVTSVDYGVTLGGSFSPFRKSCSFPSFIYAVGHNVEKGGVIQKVKRKYSPFFSKIELRSIVSFGQIERSVSRIFFKLSTLNFGPAVL